MNRRKRLRLENYDYSLSGMYFVTICIKDRKNLFGKIENDNMILNELGKIAKNNWLEIPDHFPDIFLDEYTVMPNHLHGIVGIDKRNDNLIPISTDRTKMLLSKVIQQYKGAVTREFKKISPNTLKWLRSFHDHIIRNERELNNIRSYIRNNPKNWNTDIENEECEIDDKDYYDKLFSQ
ncbi:MAG: transposase [Ignavibacteriae bacterium]|nr:transposase [Ignavibacteriota bacterium]